MYFPVRNFFLKKIIMHTKLLHKKPVPLKLKRLWLRQTFYFRVCLSNVDIFVFRILLNFDMFCNMVKSIGIKF